MTYPTGKQALQDVTLSLESPSLVGLLGPNGGGQIHPDEAVGGGASPHLRLHPGGPTPLLQCERELKAKLGYLPQTFGLYEELTVWQFLDYMAALKGLKTAPVPLRGPSGIPTWKRRKMPDPLSLRRAAPAGWGSPRPS